MPFPGPVGSSWRTARTSQTAWLQGKGDWDARSVADGYLAALRGDSSAALSDLSEWPDLRGATGRAAEALAATIDEISLSGPSSVLGENFFATRTMQARDKFAAAVADHVAGPGNRPVDVVARTAALRAARRLHAESPDLRDELRYLQRAGGEGAATLRAAARPCPALLNDESLGLVLRSFLGGVLSEAVLVLMADRLCIGFPGAAAIRQEEAIREWADEQVAGVLPEPRDAGRRGTPGTGALDRSAAGLAGELMSEALRRLWDDDGAVATATGVAEATGRAAEWTPEAGTSGEAAGETATAPGTGASTTRSAARRRRQRVGRR